jgi:hypothetical protein
MTPNKENAVSEDTAPIVVTLKAGTGYDAPWLVIRGYDPDDVTAKLEGLDPVIEATLTAAGKFAASRSLGATTVATEPAQQAAPPAKQQGWGGQSRPAGGGAPTSKYGGQLHPEGKTCEICPNVLELKKTQTGKAKWQCDAWRWGNGNPNGHTSIFID